MHSFSTRFTLPDPYDPYSTDVVVDRRTDEDWENEAVEMASRIIRNLAPGQSIEVEKCRKDEPNFKYRLTWRTHATGEDEQ